MATSCCSSAVLLEACGTSILWVLCYCSRVLSGMRRAHGDACCSASRCQGASHHHSIVHVTCCLGKCQLPPTLLHNSANGNASCHCRCLPHSAANPLTAGTSGAA
jgi:hypothetical protein